MNSNKKIFIIEDDPFYSALLQSFLKLKGFRDIHVFASGRMALERLEERPDLVLLDYDLGDAACPGKQVLQAIKRQYDQLPVIFISGQKSIHEAVQTLKKGAMDYIRKNDQTLEKLDTRINELFQEQSVLTAMNRQKKNKMGRIIFGSFLILIAVGISITYF